MSVSVINCGRLECHIYKKSATRIAYILYPMNALSGWMEMTAERYDVSIVAVNGMDWDNDLTPWPAPGAPKGSPDFKGEAPQFLARLKDVVIKDVEKSLGMTDVERRDLVGVSLSGLFAMWQWVECDLFDNIASISGSFWYPDFADWFTKNPPMGKHGRAYLSLGDLESKTKIPAFKPVEEDTKRVVSILRDKGIETTLRIVPGNHYQYPLERLDMAFGNLYMAGV